MIERILGALSFVFVFLPLSTVDASPKWYAGANSTDGTGNTNRLYSNAPNISGGSGSGNGVMMSNRALLNIRNIM